MEVFGRFLSVSHGTSVAQNLILENASQHRPCGQPLLCSAHPLLPPTPPTRPCLRVLAYAVPAPQMPFLCLPPFPGLSLLHPIYSTESPRAPLGDFTACWWWSRRARLISAAWGRCAGGSHLAGRREGSPPIAFSPLQPVAWFIRWEAAIPHCQEGNVPMPATSLHACNFTSILCSLICREHGPEGGEPTDLFTCSLSLK